MAALGRPFSGLPLSGGPDFLQPPPAFPGRAFPPGADGAELAPRPGPRAAPSSPAGSAARGRWGARRARGGRARSSGSLILLTTLRGGLLSPQIADEKLIPETLTVSRPGPHSPGVPVGLRPVCASEKWGDFAELAQIGRDWNPGRPEPGRPLGAAAGANFSVPRGRSVSHPQSGTEMGPAGEIVEVKCLAQCLPQIGFSLRRPPPNLFPTPLTK